MRPVVLTVTGSPGASNICPMDTYISPTNVGLAVTVTGTITYKVQYTFDNVFAQGYDPTTGNWFDHPTLVGTTSGNSNIAYPVAALRITTSAGTGTVTFTIIQSGGGNS